MKTSSALCASVIKKELKKVFPNTTFSVKSTNFSMGNSVRVNYTDGPLQSKVEDVVNKYQYGDFDGMEDIYRYNNHRDDIPQAQYVNVKREISPEIKNKIVKEIKKEIPNFNEDDWYEDEKCWGSTLIWRKFQQMDLTNVVTESLYYGRKLKLFEEFMDEDYELSRVMKDLEKRANYWFSEGNLAKDTQLVDIKQSETEISLRKSLIIEFNDNEFYFQLIIRVYLEDMGKCDFILKKYNTEENGMNLMDQLSLTGDKKVDVNDIKGEFVLDQIVELNGKGKNPDDNDIEIPKTETPTQGEQPPAQGSPPEGGMPPGAPPAQGAPPEGGMPPESPPTL